MSAVKEARDRLYDVLKDQLLGVLATALEGAPYANLIAFAASDDLKQIVFATTSESRKFNNMMANREVAFLVDTRENELADFDEAVAVTARGSVREPEGEEKRRLMKLYTTKHPHLNGFISEPGTSFLVIDVRDYRIVSRFQSVVELNVR